MNNDTITVEFEAWKWESIMKSLLCDKKLVMATSLYSKVYGLSIAESLTQTKKLMEVLKIEL